LRHNPGLAASPLARNNLEVGKKLLSFSFSAADGQSLLRSSGAARAPF
jgi:hypothetical protein